MHEMEMQSITIHGHKETNMAAEPLLVEQSLEKQCLEKSDYSPVHEPEKVVHEKSEQEETHVAEVDYMKIVADHARPPECLGDAVCCMLDMTPEKATGRSLERFQGDARKWKEWSFSFKGYCALHQVMTPSVMDKVEAIDSPITTNYIPADKHDANTKLFWLLTTMCGGKAQCFIRIAPSGNGLEAWRLLARRFGGESVENLFVLKRRIMNFKMSSDMSRVRTRWRSLRCWCRSTRRTLRRSLLTLR